MCGFTTVALFIFMASLASSSTFMVLRMVSSFQTSPLSQALLADTSYLVVLT